jgi:GR25 family glycosyltransferase involved in LPS biosynthesis
MSLLNEKYDRIICICLKEREDKYEFAKKQFEKHNIKVDWYRPVIHSYGSKLIEPYAQKYNVPEKNYMLFNPQFNEFGPLQSHYTVIKTALIDNIQNLFIFEDDCAFHKDWDTLLPKYLNTIPENTDGILLYSFQHMLYPESIRVKPRWTKGFRSWSIIAYGMNRKAMEAYIKLQDSKPMIADLATYVMMTEMGFNFVVASPPLIIPAKTLTSNVRGTDKNYEKIRTIYLMGVNDNDYV